MDTLTVENQKSFKVAFTEIYQVSRYKNNSPILHLDSLFYKRFLSRFRPFHSRSLPPLTLHSYSDSYHSWRRFFSFSHHFKSKTQRASDSHIPSRPALSTTTSLSLTHSTTPGTFSFLFWPSPHLTTLSHIRLTHTVPSCFRYWTLLSPAHSTVSILPLYQTHNRPPRTYSRLYLLHKTSPCSHSPS